MDPDTFHGEGLSAPPNQRADPSRYSEMAAPYRQNLLMTNQQSHMNDPSSSNVVWQEHYDMNVPSSSHGYVNQNYRLTISGRRHSAGEIDNSDYNIPPDGSDSNWMNSVTYIPPHVSHTGTLNIVDNTVHMVNNNEPVPEGELPETEEITSDSSTNETFEQPESNWSAEATASDTTVNESIVGSASGSQVEMSTVSFAPDEASDEPLCKIVKLDMAGDSKSSEVEQKKIMSDFDDDEGESCSICFNAWSNFGNHRLVALRCGHLYGHQCILKWLNSKSTKYKCCPMCKTKASISDIRFIYARKLIATDRSEIESLKRRLKWALSEKRKTKFELDKSLSCQKMYFNQMMQLRAVLDHNLVSGKPEDSTPLVRASVWLPNDCTKGLADSLDLLKYQNEHIEGLDISKWRLVKCNPCNNGVYLIFDMDERSADTIKKNNCKLCYEMVFVTFRFLEPRQRPRQWSYRARWR